MPHRLVLPAVLAVLLFPLQPLAAEAGEDPVVATVDGSGIYHSDVVDAQQRLPEVLAGAPLETVYGMLVNSLVDTRLAAIAARRQGLDGDGEFKRLMARIEEQVLERLLLSRLIGERVTEEALRERYGKMVAEAAPREEVRARHILVETESKAREVIAEYAGGADFAELAKARSTGPSAAAGGDLGFFTKGDMVPAFSEAAFALEAGAYTESPVQTPYGWHVIKVEERRTVGSPTFEEAREGLRAELLRQIGAEYMTELRDAAAIVRFKPDGSPLDR